MESTSRHAEIIARCPNSTPEALAYATVVWKVADCGWRSRRFGSMAEIIMDKVYEKINKPWSKVKAEDERVFYEWANNVRKDRERWEEDAEAFQHQLGMAKKAYHDSRSKAKLPIVQLEYHFEVNVDTKRFLVGKDFDIRRAAFILGSTEEYFKTIIKPMEWGPTGKSHMDSDTNFPDFLSYKSEDEAYKKAIENSPAWILPYVEYLPATIARLADARRDGQPFGTKGPMPNPESRQLVVNLYIPRTNKKVPKKRKVQNKPIFPKVTADEGWGDDDKDMEESDLEDEESADDIDQVEKSTKKNESRDKQTAPAPQPLLNKGPKMAPPAPPTPKKAAQMAPPLRLTFRAPTQTGPPAPPKPGRAAQMASPRPTPNTATQMGSAPQPNPKTARQMAPPPRPTPKARTQMAPSPRSTQQTATQTAAPPQTTPTAAPQMTPPPHPTPKSTTTPTAYPPRQTRQTAAQTSPSPRRMRQTATHMASSPLPTPAAVPKPRTKKARTTASTQLQAYDVPYTPTPQASGGLYNLARGNPPRLVDGTYPSDTEWRKMYDNANARCAVRDKKEHTSDWLRKRGFVRFEAIRELKAKGRMAEDEVDGPDQW